MAYKRKSPMPVNEGGSGALTLTGVLTGNGTSAFTVSTVTDNKVIRGSTSNLVQDSTINVTDAGEMTNTSQPAFLAYQSANVLNQTGAGAVPTVGYDTERFDQNSDYDGVNTFTAPVTGKYYLVTSTEFRNITAAMTSGQFRLVTSNFGYALSWAPSKIFSAVGQNTASVVMPVLADMDTGDTAIIQILIQNGAGNTAGWVGGGTTYFCGNLVC